MTKFQFAIEPITLHPQEVHRGCTKGRQSSTQQAVCGVDTKGLKPQQRTQSPSLGAPCYTQMYYLHPQGVGRGCKADKSATTTHRRAFLRLRVLDSIAFWNQNLFLISALILFLSACSSAPTRPPLLIAQVQTTEKSAHQALRDGDLLRARDLFLQTLRLHQSLDDLNGIASSSINLATLSHKLGDDAMALQLLESLLEDNAPYSAEIRSTAAFRKAVIMLDAYTDSPTASSMSLADQTISAALHIYVNSCPEFIGIKNLQARLILLKGDHLTALNLAESVLKNSAAAPEEQANAARIAGLAQNNLGQYEQALAHYLNALQTDKTLGLSSRIILDLQGIADALQKLGRTPEAENYARRAELALAAEKNLRPAPPAKPTVNNP